MRSRQTAEIIERVSRKRFTFNSLLGEYVPNEFADFKRRLTSFIDFVEEKKFKCGAGLKHLLVSGDFEDGNILDYPPTFTLSIVRGRVVEELNFGSVGAGILHNRKEHRV